MLTTTQTILIVSFLDMLGAGLIVPQLQNQARQLGCSHLLIGVMGAIYHGAQLISGPIIGNLSDLKGRKPTLLITVLICSIGYLLLGLTSSIAVFFLIRTCLGLFKQTQLLTKSITPDYERDPEQQAIVFGRLATLSGLGMSIGPMISGHIMEAFPETGFSMVAFIVGAIFTLNTALIKALPDKASEVDHNENEKKKKTNAVAPRIMDSLKSSIKESMEEFRKVDWSVYWDVFLFKLLMTLCVGMYFSNYALFLKTKHGMSPKELGYIIAFLGGVGSLSTYFIGYINQFYKDDKNSIVKTFHVFIVVTLSLIGMGVGPSIHFYLLFIVPFSIAGSVGRVSSLEMIVNKGNTDQRGSIIGASGSMRSLAGVVTPILAGLVSEYIGVTSVIYVAALFGAIGVGVSYNIKARSLADKTKSE